VERSKTLKDPRTMTVRFFSSAITIPSFSLHPVLMHEALANKVRAVYSVSTCMVWRKFHNQNFRIFKNILGQPEGKTRAQMGRYSKY
jgi:hypothetical protein